MPDPVQLPQLDIAARPSVADMVFTELHRQVLTLDLMPGAKLSEVEVARQMGVSRQPVRDAFYRLSKMGFLLIRPQRATTVTLISPEAVMRARFIRAALEVETVRVAATVLTEADLDALSAIIEAQDGAINRDDRTEFHKLDEQFHHQICARAGLGFTWDLIAENKGHMDRVRMLSLSFGSRVAWEEHVALLAALRARNADAASDLMRAHLGRIRDQLGRIRAENEALFEPNEA